MRSRRVFRVIVLVCFTVPLGSNWKVAGASGVSPGTLGGALLGQAGFGKIKGRLVWGGGEIPASKVLVKQGDAGAKDSAVCAAQELVSRELVIDAKNKGIAHGFAYLTAPKGANPAAEKALVDKAAEIIIDQKNCEFVPHAAAVHKGQALVFKASDPVGHNVRYTPFRNEALNQMMAPGSTLSRALVAGERLPVEIRCDIHPWMSARVLICDHPFFAVTGNDGSFEISGVPPGAQSLIVWQETVGFVTKGGTRGTPVDVKADETTDVGEIVLVPKK